jgi:hypothetical protein
MKIYGHVDDEVLKLCEHYKYYYIHQNQQQQQQHPRQQKGGRLPYVFTEYNVDHIGGRLPYVFTEYGIGQHGDGMGTMLRGLWRMFKPVVVAGAKAVGAQALASAGNYLGDVAAGANWKRAGYQRLDEVGEVLSDKLNTKIKNMSGAGKRHLPLDFHTHQHEPADKLRKMLDSMKNKRTDTRLNAFSITAPPVKTGRDLRHKKKLVKNKFTVAKRSSPRLRKKQNKTKKKALFGKGYSGDLLF